jgi:hypothetical protein
LGTPSGHLGELLTNPDFSHVEQSGPDFVRIGAWRNDDFTIITRLTSDSRCPLWAGEFVFPNERVVLVVDDLNANERQLDQVAPATCIDADVHGS